MLDNIIEQKVASIAERKQKVPLSVLKEQCSVIQLTHRFVDAIDKGRGIHIIGEYKKASPSAGVITSSSVYDIAQAYDAAGVSALSIITEEHFFNGSLQYISEAKTKTSLPILRKDFIIDEYQIYESKACGADAILLIVAAIEKKVLERLFNTATKIGLEVLVEIHAEHEVETTADLPVSLIGINTRNLRDFSVDMKRIETLLPLIPEHAVIVAESGISSPNDITRLAATRVNAVLVGEYLLKSTNVYETAKSLVEAGKQ